MTFTVANVLEYSSQTVYLNGVVQDLGNDYAISGSTITMSVAPATTDALLVSYYLDASIAFTGLQTPTPAVDGTTTVFTLAATPGRRR